MVLSDSEKIHVSRRPMFYGSIEFYLKSKFLSRFVNLFFDIILNSYITLFNSQDNKMSCCVVSRGLLIAKSMWIKSWHPFYSYISSALRYLFIYFIYLFIYLFFFFLGGGGSLNSATPPIIYKIMLSAIEKIGFLQH